MTCVPFLIFIVVTAKFWSTSPREYEVQLKRWNIRKNATRKEWQQYFAAINDRPITNLPLPDATGSDFSSVILSKSTASKSRARRWASGARTSRINSQASRSIMPGNEPRLLASLVPKGLNQPGNSIEAESTVLALNIASPSTEFLGFPIAYRPFCQQYSAPLRRRDSTETVAGTFPQFRSAFTDN